MQQYEELGCHLTLFEHRHARGDVTGGGALHQLIKLRVTHVAKQRQALDQASIDGGHGAGFRARSAKTSTRPLICRQSAGVSRAAARLQRENHQDLKRSSSGTGLVSRTRRKPR